MSDDEAAAHRSEIQRYQTLLLYMQDEQVRETIAELLKEAEAKLAKIEGR